GPAREHSARAPQPAKAPQQPPQFLSSFCRSSGSWEIEMQDTGRTPNPNLGRFCALVPQSAKTGQSEDSALPPPKRQTARTGNPAAVHSRIRLGNPGTASNPRGGSFVPVSGIIFTRFELSKRLLQRRLNHFDAKVHSLGGFRAATRRIPMGDTNLSGQV